MKPLKHGMLVAALGIGLGSLVWAVTPAIDAETSPPWKAVAASGIVESRGYAAPAQDWEPVKRGAELRPLTLVQTGAKGRTTLTRDAGVILVDPESRIQLPAAAGPAGASRVVQTQGTAIYEVERGAQERFEVVTPYLVAGVKGTVFGVSVREDYALVSVEEGLVEVRSPGTGETVELHPGDAARVLEERGEMEVLRGHGSSVAQRGDGGSAKARRDAAKHHRKLEQDALRADRDSRPASEGEWRGVGDTVTGILPDDDSDSDGAVNAVLDDDDSDSDVVSEALREDEDFNLLEDLDGDEDDLDDHDEQGDDRENGLGKGVLPPVRTKTQPGSPGSSGS